MAKSPDRPPRHDVDTDSLPWAASPGSHEALESVTAAVEGFTEDPTSAAEAIGGGSHRPRRTRRPTGGAGAVTITEVLEEAIVARPLAAIAIAAAAGFLAARLRRR